MLELPRKLHSRGALPLQRNKMTTKPNDFESARDEAAMFTGDSHTDGQHADPFCKGANWARTYFTEQSGVEFDEIALHQCVRSLTGENASETEVESARWQFDKLQPIIGALKAQQIQLDAINSTLLAELKDARKENYADDFNFQHEKAKRLEQEIKEKVVCPACASGLERNSLMTVTELQNIALQKEKEITRLRSALERIEAGHKLPFVKMTVAEMLEYCLKEDQRFAKQALSQGESE